MPRTACPDRPWLHGPAQEVISRYGVFPKARISGDVGEREDDPESLPTPTVYDATGHGQKRMEQKEGSKHAVSLHHLAADWSEQEDGEDGEDAERTIWPTPSACLAGQNDEYLAEMQSKDGGPVGRNERAYLPGRKHHTQMTLNRAVKLWPTPLAGNKDAAEGGNHGGMALRQAVDEEEDGDQKMWPTPRTAQASMYAESDETRLARGSDGRRTLATAVRDDEETDEQRMWPTPRTAQASMYPESDDTLEGRGRSGMDTLAKAVDVAEKEDDPRMWRTPSTLDAHGEFVREGKKLSGRKPTDPQVMLADQVAAEERDKDLWPTPRAANPGSRPHSKGGRVLSEEVEIAEDMRERGVNRQGEVAPEPTPPDDFDVMDILGDKPQQQSWPTPRANDWKGADPARDENRSGRRHAGDDLATAVDKKRDKEKDPAMLNPDWVDWLMGWPIGWTAMRPLDPDDVAVWAEASFNRTWWLREPPHIPRVTRDKTDRTQRLKADGNGQVALCAAAACVALHDSAMEADEAFAQAAAKVPTDLEDFLDV